MSDFARTRLEQNELRDHRVDRFFLFPKHWQAFSTACILKWKRVRFSSACIPHVPNDKCGVYTFVVDPGIANHPACHYLMYVGMVNESDFRTRFKSYLAEPNKKKPRDHILFMLERWSGYLWFYFAPVDDPKTIAALEDELITAYLPPANRKFPAKIRRAVRLAFS